jgi:Glycosyl hydrolase family 26
MVLARCHVRRWSSVLACGLATVLATAHAPAAAGAKPTDSKLACVYSAHSVARLEAFGRMVHRTIDCALVYNDTSPDWAGWEDPWFLHHENPDHNWRTWATAPGARRQLVITQNLFPSSENHTDWRRLGASGAYRKHARALARNLVDAGLGHAIIRLAHEANGTWSPDYIGQTERDFARWRAFWRQTVIAMRSVPGARFRFDWCINEAVRPIPLAKFYPGDDVTDIIGIDAYDTNVRAGQPRWETIYTRAAGIRDVVLFARRHGKPISIPEWGVTAHDRDGSGGDDPAYIDGIARVVRDNPTSYQSYFFKYGWAAQLIRGPRSLAAYIRHFGSGGESAAAAGQSPVPGRRTLGSALVGARAAALTARATAMAVLVRLVRRRRARRDRHTLTTGVRAPGPGRVCVVARLVRGPPVGHATPDALAAQVRRGCRARQRRVAVSGGLVAWGVGSFGARGRALLSVHVEGTPLRALRRARRGHLQVAATYAPTRGAGATVSLERRVGVRAVTRRQGFARRA